MIGILFDLDGTLLDTLEDLTDAVNYALSQHGYPPRTAREVRSYLGSGTNFLIRCSVPAGEDHEPVLKTYLPYYKTHSQVKTAPYAGILQAMEVLKSKYSVAVVSNKLDGVVKDLGAMHFGDTYTLGETSDCPRKPAPDMLYKAMKDIGVDRCIYVGDSEVDILTAKNAGVKCVSVTWGFRDEDMLVENGAEYLCHDPAQLPGIIDKIVEEHYGK